MISLHRMFHPICITSSRTSCIPRSSVTIPFARSEHSSCGLRMCGSSSGRMGAAFSAYHQRTRRYKRNLRRRALSFVSKVAKRCNNTLNVSIASNSSFKSLEETASSFHVLSLHSSIPIGDSCLSVVNSNSLPSKRHPFVSSVLKIQSEESETRGGGICIFVSSLW